MINSSDVNDLHLEDVEDYSADYPPNGFPQSENIAAVGMPAIDPTPKKRTNPVVHLMRAHKWTAGLVFITVIVFIVILSISGGSSETATELESARDSGTRLPPIHIDPKSLDPEVTAALMEKLVGVYSRHGLDPSALDDASGVTPQKKAFYWLATNDLSAIGHTQLVQRYALAVFYYATNAVANPYVEKPKPWVSAHLWLSTSHVCEWKGIVCSESDHIESIDLSRNNLTGSLPRELTIIGSTLHTLDLTSNSIYMDETMYDVFLDLTEMTTLLLDDNYMVYTKGLPSQMKMMEKLQKIRLSYNLFSGELEKDHKVLANLAQLTHLEIESNFLGGSMPPVIGELTNLVYIYMRRNEMSFNLDFLKGAKLKDLCKYHNYLRMYSTYLG